MQNKLITYSLFFILLLNFHHSFAQNKLFLCTEYQADGSYKGDYENWTIQKNGNFMYVYYESKTPVNDTVFIKIDKVFNRKDTNYYEYDHYYLVPGLSKKWAVNKYTFTKTGQYKITVYDRNNNQLAAPYFTNIELDEGAYSDMQFRDTWYYNTSKIDFYEKAVGDSMFGRNTVFTLNPTNNKVILFITQDEKRLFKTNHFFIKIYSNDKCHEFINSDTYYVNENWHWTFVPVYFNQKGKFIVEIYNDDDVFINSGTLEIK